MEKFIFTKTISSHSISRLLLVLAKKPHCENLDLAVYKAIDPFMQTNADILVGYLGAHHQILLSRFSIVEYHLVIATREFEQQGQPLSQADLAAMSLL